MYLRRVGVVSAFARGFKCTCDRWGLYRLYREPLFATPCCNTSRATWSTPSEPSHKKPFFEDLSFSSLFGTSGCCCQLVCFEFGALHFRLPCIPGTGKLENTYSCCGFWLRSWLAAVVNLFVLNLLCFISVCLYPNRETGRL